LIAESTKDFEVAVFSTGWHESNGEVVFFLLDKHSSWSGLQDVQHLTQRSIRRVEQQPQPPVGVGSGGSLQCRVPTSAKEDCAEGSQSRRDSLTVLTRADGIG